MNSLKTTATVRLLVPVPREIDARVAPVARAPRTAASALVIGFLDNHKLNSDKVLDRLQERFALTHPHAQFVRAQKPEACKPAPKEVLEELAQRCDAVVNGIAD